MTMDIFRRRFFSTGFAITTLLFVAMAGAVTPVAAQAILTLSSASGPVAKTGHTELAGPLTVTVTNGTTVAGDVEILLPVPFNTPAALNLAATGGLAGTVVTAVSPGIGLIKLTLPPGATAGDTATLNGIRVSVPNNVITSLAATVTVTGNTLAGGVTNVPLIEKTFDPLIVDPSTDAQFTFNAATFLVDALGTFTFREAYEEAFSSAVGILGRNTVTEIVFRVSGLPENTMVTFPDAIIADSGATFTTSSGLAEVVAAGDEPNTVRYLFADSLTSPTAIDWFTFDPLMSTTGTPGPGTGFIQVTIGPVGKEVPDAEFPETAVPRYVALYLPDFGLGETITKTFSFPIPPTTQSPEIVISNTVVGGADMTITARDLLGGVVEGLESNPRELTLLSRESVVLDFEELFGEGASTNLVAALDIELDNDRAVASMMARSGQNSFSLYSTDAINPAYFPFRRSGVGSMPVLSITNAGGASTFGFEMRDDSGALVASSSMGFQPGSTLRQSLDALFGLNASAVPLSGYVAARSLDGSTMRGTLLNEPGGEATGIPGLLVTGRARIVFPFFVTGSGYSTHVEFINSSVSTAAEIVLHAVGPNGAAVAGMMPYTLSVPARGRAEVDLATAFPAIGSKVGYLEMDIRKLGNNPFAGVPLLAGAVRISTAVSETFIPVLVDDGADFAFTPFASNGIEYTGLVIVNTETSNVSVTLDAFASNGVEIGTTTFAIAPGAMSIGLLRELLPDVLGQAGGFVRLSSTGDVLAFGMRGALDLSGLLYLRAESRP